MHVVLIRKDVLYAVSPHTTEDIPASPFTYQSWGTGYDGGTFREWVHGSGRVSTVTAYSLEHTHTPAPPPTPIAFYVIVLLCLILFIIAKVHLSYFNT